MAKDELSRLYAELPKALARASRTREPKEEARLAAIVRRQRDTASAEGACSALNPSELRKNPLPSDG
jgi:hypothetical protein